MRLIGREAELVEVARALTAGAEACAALSVMGEPGMGKSALLDLATNSAAQGGWLVLRCCGYEAEATLSYSAMTDLLGAAGHEWRTQVSDPQRRALDIVMLQADHDADDVEPHVVARAFTEVLRMLSARRPLLVVIDDLQWLDLESARALAFAIRRTSEQSIGYVTASRAEATETGEVRAALRSLGERHRVVKLSPLTPDEIEQLLQAQRLALPRASLRHVQVTAAGHPLYALELARHVLATGERTVPKSLTALLDARLRRLPSDALPALAAAAQMSAPTRTLIRSALSDESDAVDAAVDAALDAQVITERNGAVRFTHPLLAEVASAVATSAWRREVHRRLADAVVDDEQRAAHLSLAYSEPDEPIAMAIEAGATRARARAAPELAAELIAAALRLTPAAETESLRRRRVAGAYHNVAAGRPEAGVALMLAAVADEPMGEGRADLEWRAGMMHLLAGDMAASIDALETAREHTADRALRSQINTRLASAASWASDFERAAEAAKAIEVDQLTGIYRVNALSTVCFAEFGAARPLSIDSWQVVAEFEQLNPPPPPHEHPIIRMMHVLTVSSDPKPVADVTARALTQAVEAADDIGIAWLASALAHAELRAGRWDIAAQAATDALHAAQRAASTPARVMALGAAATVGAYRGDVEPAAEWAREAIELGAGGSLLSCVAHAHCVLGFMALAQGDAPAAVAQYARAYQDLDREIPDQLGLPPLRWYLIDALIDAGDVAAAEHRIGHLDNQLEQPLAAAVAATGRGRLAALRGARDAADAAFEHALAAHDRLGWPFERAVTLYRQGCTLRDQRRRTLAREALDEALQAFRALGSPAWELRARNVLDGISGRAPTSPAALTRSEEEVAKLAASGLTNRQIAQRLFVSPKTVATHLSHTYAKLHVRSRTELANRFQPRS